MPAKGLFPDGSSPSSVFARERKKKGTPRRGVRTAGIRQDGMAMRWTPGMRVEEQGCAG